MSNVDSHNFNPPEGKVSAQSELSIQNIGVNQIEQSKVVARLETKVDTIEKNIIEIKTDMNVVKQSLQSTREEMISMKSWVKGACWAGGIIGTIGLLPFFLNHLKTLLGY